MLKLVGSRDDFWPMGGYDDKPDERRNIYKGFDPLHSDQTAFAGFVPE
jgi:hypothetical protein